MMRSRDADLNQIGTDHLWDWQPCLLLTLGVSQWVSDYNQDLSHGRRQFCGVSAYPEAGD